MSENLSVYRENRQELSRNMPSYPHNPASGASEGAFSHNLLIDLPLLLSIFRRRLGLFLGGALITLALVLLVTFQLTPKYKATASVILDSTENQLVDISAMVSGLAPDSTAVDTEVEILRSRKIAERVATELNLFEDEEFNPALKTKSGFASILKGLFPSQIKAQENPDLKIQLEREKVVNNLLDALDVEREGLTYVITITFESIAPAKASKIADAFANQYLVEQLEAKFEEVERANAFLNNKVESQREEVRLAEQKVEDYRSANGLLNTDGSLLTEQQVTDLYAQLTAKKAELAGRQARLSNVNAQLARGDSADTIGEVLASSTIVELRSKQSDLARRKADLATRYGARHPEMVKIEREEADLTSQVDAAVSRIVASLRSEVDVSRKEVAAIEASLADIRGELSENNQSLVGLRELEREADLSRDQFERFSAQFRDTTQLVELTEADAKIGSNAAIPTSAAFPNKLLNLLLGSVLGFGIGAALVTLAEIFDNGLRTAEDLERAMNLPLVTAIPTLNKAMVGDNMGTIIPEDYLVEKPLSSFAESYRTIRNAVKLALQKQGDAKVLAMTSALSGEGKTVSALCLGRICAMSGDKVLVIDADIRRRILSGTVLDAEAGLTDVLSGTAALRDAIVKDTKTNLSILPVTGARHDLGDVFGSEGFDSMMTRLKTKFDIIIIDTAPVTAVADSRTVVTKADLVILMVRWRKTPVKVARSAMKILEKLPTPILGGVITQVDAKTQTQYGYEGSYKYYQTHQKYYHD